MLVHAAGRCRGAPRHNKSATMLASSLVMRLPLGVEGSKQASAANQLIKPPTRTVPLHPAAADFTAVRQAPSAWQAPAYGAKRVIPGIDTLQLVTTSRALKKLKKLQLSHRSGKPLGLDGE